MEADHVVLILVRQPLRAPCMAIVSNAGFTAQCPNHKGNVNTQPTAHFSTNRSQASSSSTPNWYPDTGANSHVMADLSGMDFSEAYHGPDALHVGNGKGLPILHVGSSDIHTPHKTFRLSDILHVPSISKNLLYVQKFCTDNDVFFEFHSRFFVVKDQNTRTVLLTGPSHNGLYSLTIPQLQSIKQVVFSVERASTDVWHQRLGHPHPRLLQSMLNLFRFLFLIKLYIICVRLVNWASLPSCLYLFLLLKVQEFWT